MDVRQRKTKSDRPAVFNQSKPAPAPKAEEPTTEPKKQRRSSRKTMIVAAVVLLAVCLIWIISTSNKEPEPTTAGPAYATVLPANKTIDSLGGWQRVSPPEKPPVYAYNDEINDIAISVSEQPLPAEFKSNPTSQVAELAKGYNATTKLKAGDTQLFLGTSSKGPQSVIFTKEGVLVLIKSEKTIADASWSAYVKSLSSSNLENIPKY